MSTHLTNLGQRRQPGARQRPAHRVSRGVGADGADGYIHSLPLLLQDIDIEFPPGLPPALESAIRSYSTALWTRMEAVKAEAAAAQHAARVEVARAQAKQKAAEEAAQSVGRSMADLQREAAVMGRQLEEFGAAMAGALAEVGATRAGAAETVRMANASAVYWEEVARGEAAEAVIGARAEAAAAREEVRGLKKELRRVRRELEAVKEGAGRVEADGAGEGEGEGVESFKEVEGRGYDGPKEEVLDASEEAGQEEPEGCGIARKEAVETPQTVEEKEVEAGYDAANEEVSDINGEMGRDEPCDVVEPGELGGGHVGAEEEAMEPPKVQEPEKRSEVGKEEVVEAVDAAGPEELNENPDIKEDVVEPGSGSGAATSKEVIPEPPTVPQPTSCLCQSILPTGNSTTTFSPKRLWPNGQVITYRFLDGHTTQHAKVSTVVPEWSRYAYITFRRVHDDAPSLLAISFRKKNAEECWSGLDADAQTGGSLRECTMALGAVGASRYTTQSERILILHQFGHVLGLGHEYVCPTGGTGEHTRSTPAGPSSWGIGPSTDTHFHVSVTNYVVPDLTSVMVIPLPHELEFKQPKDTLSPLDKAFMVLAYPRTRVHSQARKWTLDHALHAFGADARARSTIAGERNLARRRVRFTEFLSSARQARHALPPPVSAPVATPVPGLSPAPHCTSVSALRLPAVQGERDPPIPEPSPTLRSPIDIIGALRLPPVQNALLTFLADPASHPAAEGVLTDLKLRAELLSLFTCLVRHRAIHEVIQQAKFCSTNVKYHPSLGMSSLKPEHVGPLLGVVLMLHAVISNGTAPESSVSRTSGPEENPGVGAETVPGKGITQDAVGPLWVRLARHVVFRVAMERVVEQRVSGVEAEVTPDVSVCWSHGWWNVLRC